MDAPGTTSSVHHKHEASIAIPAAVQAGHRHFLHLPVRDLPELCRINIGATRVQTCGGNFRKCGRAGKLEYAPVSGLTEMFLVMEAPTPAICKPRHAPRACAIACTVMNPTIQPSVERCASSSSAVLWDCSDLGGRSEDSGGGWGRAVGIQKYKVDSITLSSKC